MLLHHIQCLHLKILKTLYYQMECLNSICTGMTSTKFYSFCLFVCLFILISFIGFFLFLKNFAEIVCVMLFSGFAISTVKIRHGNSALALKVPSCLKDKALLWSITTSIMSLDTLPSLCHL